MAGHGSDRRDFFISHAGPDAEWAEWVAQQLVEAGHTVELDVWDWTAGTNFLVSMQRALDRAVRMVALLSPAYFDRTWTRVEQHSAFIEHAQTKAGYLVPVIIAPCADVMPSLLRPLIAIDLIGLSEEAARARLLDGIAGSRRPRPAEKARFPGAAERATYPAGLPPIWNLPARNLFFTGREELLTELGRRLTAGQDAVSALHGGGGVGKSDLALEFAWRHAADYAIGWWVNAEDPTAVEASLTELAAALGLPVAGGATVALSRVRDHLANRADWLLIYDNVTDLGRLRPPAGGQVIVTSRDRRIPESMTSMAVDVFDRADSVGLLQRRAPHLAEADAEKVAVQLADLPLAVAQAAAYLAVTGTSHEGYLAGLRSVSEGAETAEPGEPAGVQAATTGLAGTVSTALGELARDDPEALGLLRLLSFLAAEPIPLTAAAGGNDSLPGTGGLVLGDPATTAVKVAAITRLDLARASGVNVTIHRRVLALVQSSLPEGQRAAILTAALSLLATADPGDPSDPRSWPGYAALLPHVEAVVGWLDQLPVDEPTAFRRLLLSAGRYLLSAGQVVAAEAVSNRSYDRFLETLGPDHQDTLAAGISVAKVHNHLGDDEACVALSEDILGRQRRVLGDDHPDTLRSVITFATVLGYRESTRRRARDLQQEALTAQRRVLGDDHLDTLRSARVLASTLTRLGEYQTARTLAEDALTHHRRVLGEDHPDTLTAAATLAGALGSLGELAQARELADDAFARCQRVLGDNHPQTLRAVVGLAHLRATAGDNGGARQLLADYVPRMRVVLGDGHPLTRQAALWLRLSRARLLGSLTRSVSSLDRWAANRAAASHEDAG